MHQRYRGFSEDFRLYMDKRSGWPSNSEVYGWFLNNYGGLKKDVYPAAKRGEVVGEKFVNGFLALLLAPPDPRSLGSTMRHARAVLADFLHERGIHSLTQATPESLLAHIAGPPTTEPPARSAKIDYLRKGASAIGEFVLLGTSIDRFVQACDNRTDDDVHEAVRWMYVRLGRSIAPGGFLSDASADRNRPVTRAAKGASVHETRDTELSEEDAEAIATAHIRLPLAKYQMLAVAWQRFNPWTVIYARDKSRRVGMSIVLPLQDAAYQDILDGKRASYDMTPKDLTSPSAHLLIEACAERPDSGRPADANPTRGLLMALGMQLAALSRCRDLPAGTELRLLSFAGTPKNRDRLLDTGFKATGRTMARTGAELLEHRIPLGTWRADVLVHVAMFRFFSELCDGPPPD